MLLASQVPPNPALEKQVARMLLDSGLYTQAVTLYRAILKGNPADAGAWEGLGDAQLAIDNFAAARTAFRDALKIDPTDAQARARADLCDQVLALDPTLRGLSAAERRRRSRRVLAAVVEKCSSAAANAPAAGDALGRARQIWGDCTTKPAPNDPLYLLMNKLRQ
jgi:tetratricopeptide (TPR) repeat protein